MIENGFERDGVRYRLSVEPYDNILTKFYFNDDIIVTNMTEIPNSMYRQNFNLTNVVFGTNVKNIGNEAFYNCTNIVSITIPNSVTNIGDGAFWCNTSLKAVNIPASVSRIGYRTFDSIKPEYYSVDVNNSSYKSSNGLLLSKDGKLLIQGIKGDVVIPNGVETIGEFSFMDNDELTSISFPNSVTNIENRAFVGCLGLTSVTLPNNLKSIDELCFADCQNLTSITLPASIEFICYDVFENCSNLTSVTFEGKTAAQVKAMQYYSTWGVETGTTITCTGSTPPDVFQYPDL